MQVTVGQIVYDLVFGAGTVQSISPDGNFTVQFARGVFSYNSNGVCSIGNVKSLTITPAVVLDMDQSPIWFRDLVLYLANQYNVGVI